MLLLEFDSNMLTITFQGDIHNQNLEALQERLNQIDPHQFRYVITNLEKVTFLDSSASGVIFSIVRKVKDQMGRCILANVAPQPEAVLKMIGIDNHATIVANMDDARDAMQA